MLESLYFTFNGQSSKDFGVKSVSVGGGLFNETFLPNRKVVETSIAGNPVPLFQRVDDSPTDFNLTIYVEDLDKRNNLRAIARWLYTDYYKPLVFESNRDIELDVMFIGKSEFIHNGLKDGYITLQVKSKSPYMKSIKHSLKLMSTNIPSEVEFYNNGDKPLLFTMLINKNKDRGNVSILNKNNNEEFKITDLLLDEQVYCNCKLQYLVSSLEERLLRYLGDNHNDVWLPIPPESSVTLQLTGDFSVELNYQYEYLSYDFEREGDYSDISACRI